MAKQTNVYIILIVAVVVLIAGYLYTGSTSNQMDSVIDSQKAQYDILLRQNAMPDACAAAKTVAMLYLQQEDETNYASWNATATSCEEAYIKSQTEAAM